MNSSGMPLKIAVAGASGRMGQMLVEAVGQADDMVLVSAMDMAGAASIGVDAGAFLGQRTDVLISADASAMLAKAEYVIDFTRPEGTLALLPYCVQHGVKMIIGTTGFDDAGRAA